MGDTIRNLHLVQLFVFCCTRSELLKSNSSIPNMRDTRIELVSQRWQRYVLPLNQSRMSFDRLGV